MDLKNKIKFLLKRHPVFFYVRYILIGKNIRNEEVATLGCFNDSNNLEDLPAIFFEFNNKFDLGDATDEFDKAIKIATYLRANLKGGTALSLSSSQTMQQMIAGKGGVCGDFSQIFSIFCFINDIKVKEWHCVDSLYKPKYGHTFNEIYSSKLNKWIAFDSHKNIYFAKDTDETPLSCVELFTTLRIGEKIKFIIFSSYQLKNFERLPLVYAANSIPYIIGNYNNKTIDYYLDKYEKKYPPFIVNFILILLKKNYNFIFAMDNYKKLLFPVFYKK